ncbi:MAG: type II toxin-antitoxin system MqsA family antitoxin [Terriglobia bacterium]
MRRKSREATVRCENCGRGGAHVRQVTRSYGRGSNLLVVERVPVVSCPYCGATYLTAEALREIERIKTHRLSLAKRRDVAVAEFA